MSHHAYYFIGTPDEGVAMSTAFAKDELGITIENGQDLRILTYGLLSVEDVRTIINTASRTPVQGEHTAIVISAPRIFHEAQNALLKLFEEPPRGVTLFLIIPSLGMLLPTLRSRVLPLPGCGHTRVPSTLANTFIALDAPAREKYITKLLERTKSDGEDEKQSARADATQLIEGLIRYTHEKRASVTSLDTRHAYTLFLKDLERFTPILHTRSAPLKLIFEHILIVLPL